MHRPNPFDLTLTTAASLAVFSVFIASAASSERSTTPSPARRAPQFQARHSRKGFFGEYLKLGDVLFRLLFPMVDGVFAITVPLKN